MKVGIVILNYNDYDTTVEIIEKIKYYHSIEYKVVVDNFSNDGSFEKLKKINDGSWDLIRTTHNGGYAAGNNHGIRYLINKYRPEVICISNPDIIFDEVLVKKIIMFFEAHEDVAVVTGLQTDRKGNVYQHAFWDLLDRKKAYKEILRAFPILAKLRKNKKNNSLSYVDYHLMGNDLIIEVPVVSGCYFYIRTEDLEKIGYFDEETFLFYEEDIMAWKLAKLGRKTVVLKDCRFIHLESESIGKIYTSFKKRKILYKSREYFFSKYLSNNKIDSLIYKLLINLYLYESQFIAMVLINLKRGG